MEKLKKIFSVLLCMTLLFTSVGATGFSAMAADTEELTGAVGKINTAGIVEDSGNSATGLTYKSQFKENWEQGLSLDKWYVERYKDSYVSNFQVVDDPLGNMNEDGTPNQVITWTRFGTWLIPTDEYWPSIGLTAGDISQITFRMYMKNPELSMAVTTKDHEPGIACVFKSTLEHLGFQFATHDALTDSYGVLVGPSLWDQGEIITANRITKYSLQRDFTSGFDWSNWIDVAVSYNGNKVIMTMTDHMGTVHSFSTTQSFAGGKYAIGNRGRNKLTSSRGDNIEQTNGVTYIDDIVVSFNQSTTDKDDVQKDVTVYYAGNTFLNPGDTLNITGEDLGSTVASAEIMKLDDALLSTNPEVAKFIYETTYDKAYTKEKETNVDWETFKACAVPNSLIEDFKIEQRSEVGIKMLLPDGQAEGQEMYAEAGVYAVLLKAAAEDGKPAIVVVNNPQIITLLHDDGEAATPNGWLKLSGYNLSVQNSLDKVSAVIIDKSGNRRFVDRSNIEVDTTESNGVSNDYYMMIHLEGMSPGEYQVIVHNGYGGEYAWSVPFDFSVNAMASNMEWRAKGTFNVQDYGAVGDGVTNDTAAIMSAISAAEQNGGGMVYFPGLKNGQGAGYRITMPLIVGENTSLVGDGADLSIVFYDGDLEATKQKYFISFEKNIEISDIQFSCQTNPFANFLYRSTAKNQDAGKIYIDNAYFMIDPNGHCSWSRDEIIMEGYSWKTARIYLSEHWNNTEQYHFNSKLVEQYVRINETYWNINGEFGAGKEGIFTYAQYVYINELPKEVPHWSEYTSKTAGVVENSYASRLEGNTCYRNIKAENNTSNNRELFTNDGGLKTVNLKVEPLLEESYTEEALRTVMGAELDALSETKQGELLAEVQNYLREHTGKAYRFLQGSPSTDGWIYVTYGQGTGQMRYITNRQVIGKYMYFTVEDAFAIAPNRSSQIAYDDTVVQKSFVNNLSASGGSAVEVYGAGMDIVFDHITMRNASSGVLLRSAYEGLMWYNSIKNSDARDIGYLHNSVAEFGGTGAGVNVGGSPSSGYVFLGIRYADSYFGENAQIDIRCSAGKPITLSDVVFEHLDIVASEPAINMHNLMNMQGLMLRDIHQVTEAGKAYNDISPYDQATLGYIRNGQKTFVLGGEDSQKVWCNHVEQGYKRVRGDIDGDGMVVLKDVSLLRKVLGEEITIDELDTSYGTNSYSTYCDLTENGTVDSCDFLYLRAYIMGDDNAMKNIKATDSGEVVEEPEPGTPDTPDSPDYVIKQEDVIIDYSYTQYLKDEDED